jgi:hypothetical protein
MPFNPAKTYATHSFRDGYVLLLPKQYPLWHFKFMAYNTQNKNPAAVALGRLGGLKGGKARAAKLSSAERSEGAKKAAAARWAKGRKKAR